MAIQLRRVSGEDLSRKESRMYAVYVLSRDGTPLMPAKRFGHVRRLLKEGKATVPQRQVLFLSRAAMDSENPLVKDIKSYKATGDLMNSLMDSWKAVKSAGHETDEALWKEFSAARQEFFTKRRAFYEERDAQRKESIDAKRALIEKAKEIAARNDYSRETTDEMKQLDVEWKKLGYSGKDENDRLWDEFKAAKDVFWNGKHDASQARFKSLIDRKDEQIRNMREQVNRLEERVYETDDFEEEQDLNRRAAQKKNIIENMKKDIEDLKSKLDD